MARQRTTFGKLQRERDRQAKQQAKFEKRLARSDQTDDDEDVEVEEPTVVRDEAEVLASLAKLHEAYDDGQLSLDEFELRRDRLRAELQIS